MRASLRWFIVILAATLAVAPTPLTAQQAQSSGQEMLFGTWQLNVARSKYVPGPPPKSEIRIYARDGSAVKATIRRVLANGRSEVVEYTANYDNPSPVTGSEAIDRILMRRIDEHSAQSVLSHAGRVFGVARRVISPDGKSMVITFRREGNELVNNRAHYDRATP